jgi:cobalt-zinc-cadmium efflux system outer membrane protein
MEYIMSLLKGMVSISILGLSLNTLAVQKCDFKNANELLEAIKKNHPTLLKNAKEVEMAKINIDGAGKYVNPELEIEGGTDLDESSKYSSSIKLTQTIELGGKRSARVETAKNEFSARKTLSVLEAEELIIKTVQDIYKLRHMSELIPLYVESIDAFQRIYKKLSNRTSLSAEQQVERETLELAIGDYKLKLANLRVDLTYLNNHLSYFAGVDCKISKMSLPGEFNLKTKVKAKSTEELTFSKLRYAKQYVELQRARLSEEESKAYSDLRIGPTFEIDKDDQTVKKAGIALSFDLPIFNRNSSAKAMARTALDSATMVYNRFKKESQLDLHSWQTQYNKYVRSLRVMDGKSALERKHKKVESLFKRGIISTSMVIESHRQLIEFTTTRNEFELGAVEALWNIYNHSGVVMTKEI